MSPSLELEPRIHSHPASVPISRSPWVRWHLLSLDAPTIAVLWTCFLARITRTPVPLATPVAMALAVWTLYAGDRLLDGRLLVQPHVSTTLEARHLFHFRHKAGFRFGIALATMLLAALLPRLAPEAIHLYLTEAALMAGYFLLIHAFPEDAPLRRRIPKELLVGPFFAAATFIPTIARSPALRPALLPLAVLFAAVCSLNCLFIHAWEHPHSRRAYWLTRQALRHLVPFTFVATALSLIIAFFLPNPALRLYPSACGLSLVLLLTLHRSRERFSRLALRVAADAALLTPLLLLPFLFRA